MPQYTQLQDKDVIPEGTPPAGAEYKRVTGREYNAALHQATTYGQAAPDLRGWGPEATRRLYNEARDQINAEALPPEKKKALLDVVLKISNGELATVKAPPIISQQANNSFAQTSPSASPAPASADDEIRKAALIFARGARGSSPDMDNQNKWTPEKQDDLRDAYAKQMQEDVREALNVARLLQGGADPGKIDDIQNPILKKIVANDMEAIKAGKPDIDIRADLLGEMKQRNYFANSAIENGYPASAGFAAATRQKLASASP